jgi:hypothetical protein
MTVMDYIHYRLKMPKELQKFEHSFLIRSNKVQKRIDKINKIFYECRSN